MESGFSANKEMNYQATKDSGENQMITALKIASMDGVKAADCMILTL